MKDNDETNKSANDKAKELDREIDRIMDEEDRQDPVASNMGECAEDIHDCKCGIVINVGYLHKRIAELERDLNLAIAHDRQPYPTAEAYKMVCETLHPKEEKIASLESSLEGLKKRNEILEAVTHLCYNEKNESRIATLEAKLKTAEDKLKEMEQKP